MTRAPAAGSVTAVSEDPSRPPLPPYDPDRAPATQDDPSPSADVSRVSVAELSEAERTRALERIEARQGFIWHLVSYVIVMLLLNGIWLATGGPTEFYWPIFPMMGWGVGLLFHGAGIVLDREPSEEDIAAEVARMRRRRGGASQG